MGKNGKFIPAITCRIAAQTQKIKQAQNKSTYKYHTNLQKNQKPDVFVKVTTESIAEAIKAKIEKFNI